MDVRPELQLQTMIKAMTDIVLPAVDADNRLAQEQARLVIATLQLVAKRLLIAYRYDRYDRDELTRYVALAADLLSAATPQLAGEVVTRLDLLAAQGAEVLARARAEPLELETAVVALRASVGQLTEASRAAHDPTLGRLVLAAAKVELDRALVVDIGFEADPDDMPAPILEQLPPVYP